MQLPTLTSGPIPKQLWQLSWPMMLSIFFYTLYNLVDTYWVSLISDEAIAAVSISQISLMVMVSLGFGITAGSGVIMSNYIGAKDQDNAEGVLGQSFVLSVIMAVLFTGLALLFADEFLTASGASGAIFDPAKEYFLIVSAGSVLLFIMFAIMFAFNAQGDTTTLTKLFALSTGINLILDPALIFGWQFIPAMGIKGAAVATLISQSVFIIVALKSLSNPKRPIRFRTSKLRVDWSSVGKVLNIGFPAALTQVVFPVGLGALTYIIAEAFQEPGAVAFSLGFRIEFFAYLPAVGFGFGAMAMMGQNIGAGNMQRANEAFKKALWYAFIGAGGLGVIAAIFAGPVIGVFTDDPVVSEYAHTYLFSVALSYGFLAALLVEANAFQSIGKSWPGFWIFLLRVAVITLPLAYILCIHMDYGIYGIWTAVIVGNVIPSIVGFIWIKRKLKKLVAAPAPNAGSEEETAVLEA